MTPNPQAENGHIDIANEIAEALCRTQLSGYESRILWALFRKTYGWHKKEDRISLSQFQILTGLPIPKISNTLKRLELRKMVSVTKIGKSNVKTYGFQKIFSLWQELPKSASVTKIGKSCGETNGNHKGKEDLKGLPFLGIAEKGITKKGFQELPKSASTKETITKENNNNIERVFEEKKDRIKELFPHADFESEKEHFIQHFKGQCLLDPYEKILSWFKRINKAPPKTFKEVNYVKSRDEAIAELKQKGLL